MIVKLNFIIFLEIKSCYIIIKVKYLMRYFRIFKLAQSNKNNKYIIIIN